LNYWCEKKRDENGKENSIRNWERWNKRKRKNAMTKFANQILKKMKEWMLAKLLAMKNEVKVNDERGLKKMKKLNGKNKDFSSTEAYDRFMEVRKEVAGILMSNNETIEVLVLNRNTIGLHGGMQKEKEKEKEEDGDEDENENEADTLHQVVQSGDYYLVKLAMKDFQGDINNLDSNGKTVLDYAQPNSKIYELLQQAGGKKGVDVQVNVNLNVNVNNTPQINQGENKEKKKRKNKFKKK